MFVCRAADCAMGVGLVGLWGSPTPLSEVREEPGCVRKCARVAVVGYGVGRNSHGSKRSKQVERGREGVATIHVIVIR